MLILSRRPDESLVIGDSVEIAENVTVTILSIKGRQVRIGINAPKDVAVNRSEIYERIQAGAKPGAVTNVIEDEYR